MKRENIENIFCENLKLLEKNLYWLMKSYKKAESIDLNKDLSEEDFEVLETLSNRFGRTVDILINKVLRGLDILELEDISRKLDIVIRAEKRGFVDNYKILIEMKDLRDELVHEYIQENLVERFKEILIYTPELFNIINKLKLYVKSVRYCVDRNSY